MEKVILITGVSGFIGSELAKRFFSESWKVIGTSRSGAPLPYCHEVYKLSLGDSFPEINQNVDLIVHCAVAVGKNELDLNLNGTKKLIIEGTQFSSQQIFFSSISAISHSTTPYANAKKELESFAIQKGAFVIRLGLVSGRGGLFDRMRKMVAKFPILPLLGKDSVVYLTPVSSIGDLLLRPDLSLVFSQKKIVNFFQETAVNMKCLLEQLKQSQKTTCFFIVVPVMPVYFILRGFEFFLPNVLPVSSSSVKGVKENKIDNLHSDYSALGFSELSLANIVCE